MALRTESSIDVLTRKAQRMTSHLSQRDRAPLSQGGAAMCDSSDPLSGFDPSARAELAFCSALEDSANQLPEFCLRRFTKFTVALRTMPKRQEAQRMEQRLSQVAVNESNAQALSMALAMIDLEEREDADTAMELADTLDEVVDDGAVANPNALGYLMRSFFENRRRHLAWRREAFVEPARRTLEPPAFAFVTEPLRESRTELRVLAMLDAP